MDTESVAEFAASLRRVGGEVVPTTAADFETALAEQLVEPAVGAPLPFEDLSLAGVPVNTTPTAADLREARTGVTAATFGVAAHGTLAVESRPEGDEPTSLYPERHVAVLRASDVVPDLPAAFDRLADAFAAGRTSTVLATGPSATADMGALVHGVHGPAEVRALVVEDA